MATITPDILSAHNVTADEYSKILSILGREPNLTELGIFSVMWSEHCSYKSSRVHLKKLPTRGKQVLRKGAGKTAEQFELFRSRPPPGRAVQAEDKAVATLRGELAHHHLTQPRAGLPVDHPVGVALLVFAQRQQVVARAYP